MEYIFDFQFSLINNHLSIINIYAVFAGFGETSGYNLVMRSFGYAQDKRA